MRLSKNQWRMAPLNKEICWRSGGFETDLAASKPVNDASDAVAFRRSDPGFVKSVRSNPGIIGRQKK
jgi:hypothetical protein